MNSVHFLALGLPGGPEMIFIGFLVVLLFGAKKLPELARGLGRSIGEFKRAQQEFSEELQRSTDVQPTPPQKLPNAPAQTVSRTAEPAQAPVDHS